MKKLLLIFSFFVTQVFFAQNSAGIADLKGAEIVNSTALSLLDNTAAIITSNPDCKDFSINTENLSNISFDVSLNNGKLNGLEYYGLGKETKDFRQVHSNKLLRPYLSGVLNKNDSVANFAVGISVNVLTIFRVNKKRMTDSYEKMRTETMDLVNEADKIMARDFPHLNRITTTEAYNNQRVKVMDSIPTGDADEFAEILQRPLLTLDLASAYSVLYPDNTFNESQPDRLGVWSTLTVANKLTGKNNYLNVYGFVRYLEDKSVFNETAMDYSNEFKYFDFGGKVQLDFNNLSFGYEYIKRNGDGKDYRSVGIIQYKVNTEVYLTGGFGKNFQSDSDKDLVTMFGIRWGINEKNKKAWTSK